jgi:hypothetical protein
MDTCLCFKYPVPRVFILLFSIKRYNIVIISNLPSIILIIRNILDTVFISIEVIPVVIPVVIHVVIPVVVKAETDSKSESIKLFFSK